MSDIKIIGLAFRYLNNVSLLPPRHNFGGELGEVIFHSDPRVELQDGKRVSNVDAFIDLRTGAYMDGVESFHKRYYQHRRPSKQAQYFKLLEFNETQENPILTAPRQFATWADNRSDHEHPLDNYGILDCDEVVMKDQYGSSGCNHVVAPSHMVQSMLFNLTTKTGDEFAAAYPDVIISRGSNTDKPLFEKHSDITVTERITNITKEWRLLFAGSKVYIREREITPGDYSQSNLCAEVIPTIPVVKYVPLHNYVDIPEEVVNAVYGLIHFVKLPFGSVDLYQTSDDQWGIFEYCEQFGFHGADHKFIRQLHLDGIESILKELFDI